MQNESVDVRWDFGALPKFSHAAARYAIGLSHTRGENQLRAALVRSLGRGHQMVCDPIDGSAVELPAEVLKFLSRDVAAGQLDVHELSFWRTELADRCSLLTMALMARAKNDHQEPVALCVDGLCVWTKDEMGRRRHHSLCDAAQLAERTGITVVDDLPGADLAHRGCGAPMTGMADWILFGDRSGIPGQRNRGILRFGWDIRVTLVPSRTTRIDPPEIVAIDAGPGMQLLQVVRTVLDIRDRFDTNAAVQETPVASLVDKWICWAADNPNDGYGELVDWIASDIVEYSEKDQVSPARWMMTCVEFIARQAAGKINAGMPKSTPICELVLSGHLHLDGLLQSRLRHHLTGVAVRSGEPIVEASSLDPIATAVMAFLRIDNAIGNSARQTGTTKPRSLGRLTPGRPSNWNSVLAEMSEGMHSKMTLKTAV